jgi:hypothetical protein
MYSIRSYVRIVKLGALAITAFLVGKSSSVRADLDPKFCSQLMQTQVFTSASERLRLVVPRGWCGTETASYPGLVLWMLRAQPAGQIALTAEAYTRELYCSWPVECRQQPTNASRYGCALRKRLAGIGMRVGPIQLGPREDIEQLGLDSVWFEYDDGKRFLRQAVAVTDERAMTLVLSASSLDARASHTRAFDQALRSMQVLSAAAAASVPTASPPPDPAAAGSGAAPLPLAPPTPRPPAVGACR